uniref:Uncharacterized protein n=1 Tax=Sphenodon punctatus TaxID=8508 RepID=A0A8D0G833_SPHPU
MLPRLTCNAGRECWGLSPAATGAGLGGCGAMIRAGLQLLGRGPVARVLSGLTSNSGIPANVADAASQVVKAPAEVPSLPILRQCSVAVPRHRTPVQAWVESLQQYDNLPVGLTDLHPDVFAVMPR